MNLVNSNSVTESDDSLDSPIKVVKILPNSFYTTEEAHRQNYTKLFFFEKAGGNHLIDFVNYKIKPYSVYSVVSNKVHFVSRLVDSLEYVLMIRNDFFKDEILKTNYSFLIECEELQLDSKLFNIQTSLIKEIEEELKTDSTLKNKRVLSIVHVMLSKLGQFIEQGNLGQDFKLKDEDFYKYFYALLEQNYSLEKSPQFYADRLNISIPILNNVVKKATGKTISQLIKSRLLLEVKRLLFCSSLNIKEISALLNFTNSEAMYRFFRRAEDCSPSQYKEKFHISK